MSTGPSGRGTAFGHQIRHWRKRRGLTQLELAVRAEVSQRHISFIESGRSRPGLEFINKVTDALEVPARERNALLVAAGMKATFPEDPLSDRAVTPYRHAINHCSNAIPPIRPL